MKTVRDSILDYFHKNRHATVAELSQALHVTKADVRYHLKELAAGGEIEKATTVQPAWKGRPTRLFQLTDKARPGNYQRLADALLSFCDGNATTAQAVSQVAEQMAQSIPHARQRAAQLNRLVSFLTANAYDATWEAHAAGPRIIFRNCPYAAILERHPQLCAMDNQIIEKFLDFETFQTSRIDLGKVKKPTCIFQIEPRPRPK